DHKHFTGDSAVAESPSLCPVRPNKLPSTLPQNHTPPGGQVCIPQDYLFSFPRSVRKEYRPAGGSPNIRTGSIPHACSGAGRQTEEWISTCATCCRSRSSPGCWSASSPTACPPSPLSSTAAPRKPVMCAINSPPTSPASPAISSPPIRLISTNPSH